MKTLYKNFNKWEDEFEAKSYHEQYNFIMETLKQPISKLFIEKTDIEMLIVDFVGEFEKRKEFDKIFKIIEILQYYQPDLYNTEHQYFDEFLIDYYLFHNDRNKLDDTISRFIENPVESVDVLLSIHKKIILYKYNDIADILASKTYKTINESPELIGSAGYSLALAMYYTSLEQLYIEYKNTGSINLNEFSKKIRKFDFKPNANYLELLKKGLTESIDSKEQLHHQFTNDTKNYISVIECYFLKYMLEQKEFSFAESGILWNGLLNYWSEYSKRKGEKPDKYFSLKKEKLDEYIVELMGGIFATNKAEGIAVLWGAVYIYDFLLSINLISERVYRNVIAIVNSLKADIIKGLEDDLWKYNFIHNWKLQDGLSEEEFDSEKDIFKKSFNVIS